MLRDAQVIAVVPTHPEAGVGAAQGPVPLHMHAVCPFNNHAIVDRKAIALRAASHFVPGVCSRSFGRAKQQSGKAQGER
jgi:hypothetical protein